MRLSYRWLKQLVNFKESPEKLAEILDMHIAHVENVERLTKKMDKVIAAEIIKIKPHPNADKLQIAIVKTIINNQLSIISVVCGAWNIKVGQKVPLALPGAGLRLKATDDKANILKIEASVIRGIKSEGMLCAENELGISSDHTGIFILPPETKIGEPVTKILGLDDTILEVENKSITHRPDLFGHLGVAREISVCLGQAKIKNKNLSAAEPCFQQGKRLYSENKIPKIKNTNKKSKNSQKNLSIKVEGFRLCPRYMAVVMDNIKIGPSPLWLQNRLRSLGLQPINNVIDATNYVMMEIGQPLHAFDANKLAPTNYESQRITNKKIIVRRAKKGEGLLALDGKEYELSGDDLVIADVKKPIALAGIIGGEKSGITEQTKTIIIESANFDPVTIRRTSWRLGLRTEAALRFEKGLPINFPEIGINRAIELIQEIAGGKVASEIYDERCPVVTAKLTQPKKILINSERVNKIIGPEIEKNKILSILKGLGFKIEEIDLIKTLVKLVKEQIGKPFKYGASTLLEAPDVFDCSSLIRWLYRQIGIELPRASIEQIEEGMPIEINQLKAGDLVFSKGYGKPHYNQKYPKGVGHVGIYIGQGKAISAKIKKKKVVLEGLRDFADKKDWRGARRIIQAERGLVIEVPVFRPDLDLEEDIIEEIVRIYGTEKIKPQPIISELKPISYEPEFGFEREIKNILIGISFDEVYNYSFESQIRTDRNTDQHRLEIMNPLNLEQQYLRTSLLTGLIRNAEKNAGYFDEFKIFEIGRVFYKAPPTNYESNTNIRITNSVEQPKHLAGLICTDNKDVYFLIKGIVELILEKSGIENYDIKLLESEIGNPISEVIVDNQPIGLFGLLEPELVDLKTLRQAPAKGEARHGRQGRQFGIFEINLEKLGEFVTAEKEYQPISIYPPMKRDLAFLIDKKIKWQEIFETVKNIHPLIRQIELFDIFEDKRFKEKRNLAFHIIYQASNRTLKTEEVEKIEAQIIKILKEKFEAELRNF